MSEKESNVTIALVEASEILRGMAEPYRGKRALLKLSGKLPWSYRHIKAVFYREEKTVVCADEMRELKRAAKLAQQEQEANDEVRALRERIEKLEHRLAQTDPEFHSETLAALRMVDRGPERKGPG